MEELKILEQALDIATKSGSFGLRDTANISNALASLGAKLRKLSLLESKEEENKEEIPKLKKK